MFKSKVYIEKDSEFKSTWKLLNNNNIKKPTANMTFF